MKYVFLLSIIFLSGCQSTPSFCETTPSSPYCDESQYHHRTSAALKEFESYKRKKAFAIGKAEDGWEFFGFSQGYQSKRKAQARAMAECQRRLKHHGSTEKCQLIR